MQDYSYIYVSGMVDLFNKFVYSQIYGVPRCLVEEDFTRKWEDCGGCLTGAA